MKYRTLFIGSVMLGALAPGIGLANEVVPVVDASETSVSQTMPMLAQAKNSSNSGVAQIYYELELLKSEVQDLRGIVEEQSHQINRMREEQRERYLDLDRRVSQRNQTTPADAAQTAETQTAETQTAETQTAETQDNVTTGQTPAVSHQNTSQPELGETETEAYQQAFSLVRNKQYGQAVTAFRQFIKDYPDAGYTGNAYYWLGEVLLVDSKHKEALNAFEALLKQFPEHRKAADAKYKVGKIYQQLGDNARAKKTWQEVVSQYAGSSAAKLAETEVNDARL